jgi:predicted porin/cell division protein FtsB
MDCAPGHGRERRVPQVSKVLEKFMKSRLMMCAAVGAVLVASGAARADDAEVKALKAQSAELKKQNDALEARLSKLEQQQVVAQPANARNFLAADLPGIKGPLPCEFPSLDGPLTFCGITLYGAVDGGFTYAAHGLPINGKYYNGNEMLQSKAAAGYFGFNPNGLQQSVIGVKGSTEILPGVSGVFTASTYFNPQSGQLQNAPGSLVDNQGLNYRSYSINSDGSRGGQAFNDQLNVGFSTKTFGQLTFGRHRSLANDLVSAYDATGGAPAFSIIGSSGTYVSGLGITETARWDDSLKYKYEYAWAPGAAARVGAIYKFVDGNNGGSNIAPGGTLCTGANAPVTGCAANSAAAKVQQFYTTQNDAGQVDLGFSYAGLDVDGVLGYFNQAVNISAPLSAAQLSGISTFTSNNWASATALGVTTTSFVTTNSGTLAATAADVTGGAIGAKYTWEQFKFYSGWAHEVFHNPKNNVGLGSQNDQGGYVLSSVNNANYYHARLLDTFWFGVKYAYDPKTDIIATYQFITQNGYGSPTQLSTCSMATFVRTGAGSAPRSSACSGTINQAAAYVDYHFTKRFDVYGGLNFETLDGGLASGFIYTTQWAPTVGARFVF